MDFSSKTHQNTSMLNKHEGFCQTINSNEKFSKRESNFSGLDYEMMLPHDEAKNAAALSAFR